MKSFMLALFFLLPTATASAQSGWAWQNPLPQGNSLYAIQFVSDQVVYAVGNGGIVLKSTDSGLHWRILLQPERFYALSLHFVDAQRGWVGGQPGYIVGTTDGGDHWTTQLFDPLVDFQTITFIDQQCGWASGQGAKLYHTTDGGGTWQLHTNFPFESINALSFSDSLHGWGVASVAVRIRTTDGGIIWSIDSVGGGWDVSFIDSLTGWVLRSSQIQKSTDGGTTWTVQFDTADGSFVDLCVLNERQLWAVSQTGFIVHSSNGGATWEYQTNPLGESSLEGVAFADSSHGFAVGFEGVLLETTNGGGTWRDTRRAASIQPLFGVHFIDAENGWAAGWSGSILRTTNGGTTWDLLPTGTSECLFDICFVDAEKGWTVGRAGTILRSTNGGMSWTHQISPVIRQWRAIEFSQYPTGWIIGSDVLSDGRLLKTTDGGEIWNADSSVALPQGAAAIQFSSAQVGWIMVGSGLVGSSQRIYRTNDAGNSWSVALTSTDDTAFSSISFPDDSTGFVSTDNDFVFRTTNSGVLWQRLLAPGFINALAFRDRLTGWAADISGEIHHTTDGGETWTPQRSPAGLPLRRLAYIGPENLWAVGEGGAILHTSNGGSTFVRESAKHSAASAFRLLNNFPNPFNPSTTIRYALPHASFVMLTIYNMLGQEVALLVNEQQQAGYHEAVFRGNGLASGVYFYQLRAGSYVSTRKLLMLR